MIVKDIMTTAVKAASPDTSIKEIASIMCFNKISGVPVVDENEKLVGVLSEKDILHCMFPQIEEVMGEGGVPDYEKLEGNYQNIMNKKVSDLMTSTVATVDADIPVLKAAAMMWLKKIRRIPVIEGDKLVGIISIGDVHKAIFQNSLVNS